MTPLPLDRPLTVEEQRGFSMACAAIAQMGRAMQRAPSLAPDGSLADVLQSQRAHGAAIVAVATAFERTIGAGRLRRPEPLPGRF
jgi:hypothetical protein